MLLDLGYGDLDISDIKIGETAIGSYDGVEWEIGTTPSLFTQDIYELQVGVALNDENDVAQRTTQTATTEISLDLLFPQGLFGVNAKGDTVMGTCEFAIQYRAVGATTWTTVNSSTNGLTQSGFSNVFTNYFYIKNTRRKMLRLGVRWKVPSGQYEVAITRGSSTFTGAASASAEVGGAVWSVLRSINPQLPSTSGTNKLAVRIKATDQLNGVVQNLSVLAAQKVRRWDAVN